MLSVILLQSQIQKALYTYTAPLKKNYRNHFQIFVGKHLLGANFVTTVPAALQLKLHSDVQTENLQLKITRTIIVNIRVNEIQHYELRLIATSIMFMGVRWLSG